MPTAPKAVAGGMLRSRVRVLQPAGTITATGGTTTGTPTTVIDGLWVSIEPLELNFQIREQLASGGLQAQLTHLIRARRNDDITSEMHLLELDAPSRTFQIVSRRVDVYADELHLLCQERLT